MEKVRETCILQTYENKMNMIHEILLLGLGQFRSLSLLFGKVGARTDLHFVRPTGKPKDQQNNGGSLYAK